MIESLATDRASEQIVLLMCQGWLDILALGHIAANTNSSEAEKRLDESTIYASLEAGEVGNMLHCAAEFCSSYLNQGNFEGASGANPMTVMKMQVVSDMLLVCKRAVSASTKRLALVDLFTLCQTDAPARKQISRSFDNLLAWLFLSGRLEDEEKELANLSNTSLSTPATVLAK